MICINNKSKEQIKIVKFSQEQVVIIINHQLIIINNNTEQ